MIEVVPIASSSIDLMRLLSISSKLLNRSIARGLDERKIPLGDFASYISSLGEFECENSDPATTLREAGALLRHLHFTFLCISTQQILQEIAIVSGLSAIFAQSKNLMSCMLLSGSLEQWYTAILACCTERTQSHIRLFADRCLLHFERNGLSQLWSSYEKRTLSDTTFQLQLRK